MENTPRVSNGLWKKEKDGKTYLNGKFKLNGVEYWISIYKTENKKNENSPDYYFFEPNPVTPQAAPLPTINQEEEISVEDIPFN